MKAMKLIFISSLVAGTAHAASNFTLDQRGDEVCRIESSQVGRCMPTLKSLGLYDQDSVEVTDILSRYSDYLEKKKSDPSLQSPVRANIAVLQSESEISKTLRDYSDLSVRMMSTDSKLIQKQDGTLNFPFQASLFWKNRKIGINGTIYFEGTITLKTSGLDLSNDVRQKIRDAYSIDNFSDGNTEQKKDLFSFLETGSREVHFHIIGTDGLSVDDATLALLKNTVGPIVAGEILGGLFLDAGKVTKP